MKLHLSQLLGTVLRFEGSVQEKKGVYSFRFKANRWSKWEAGQYYVYFMPGAVLGSGLPLRPFTVAAAPSDGLVQITTRYPAQPSRFKLALQRLRPGQLVIAAGPYGFFTEERMTGSQVFIAGGIGITPFRAMLREYNNRGLMPKITLLYSSRDKPILFQEELDDIASAHPELSIHYLGESEQLGADTISKYVPDTPATTYWLSGPKPMVTDLSAVLETKLSVQRSRIKHDSFKGYPWPLS